jgi:hypothetical protein
VDRVDIYQGTRHIGSELLFDPFLQYFRFCCPSLLQRSLIHHSSNVASVHSNKNEKTTEKLITEIRSRRDWIGVDFLDDSKDKEDGIQGEKPDTKSIRLLDYACGNGMISQVSLFIPFPNSFLYGWR